MTEVQEEILNRLCPEYEDIKGQLEKYSDYELNLVIYNLPNSIDELQDSICLELQWDILGTLCSPFIHDWDNFYSKYEEEIIDYCWNGNCFISYNDANNSYEISKQTIRDICLELISSVEAEEDYTLNEEVDFSEVIAHLNKYYPVKFCEV